MATRAAGETLAGKDCRQGAIPASPLAAERAAPAIFASVPLFAPLAVAVEIREERPDDARRVFRLSRSVADSGILLERPAPFEVDQPVTATFTLPETTSMESLCLRAVVALTDSDGDGSKGGAHLVFVDAHPDARQAIVKYVTGRLGLSGR